MAYTPIDWVWLCSVAELNRTQSNGLSMMRFDLFDWVRLVQRSFSHRFRCSISFDCRTQLNSINRLGSIEFNWVRFPNVWFAIRGVVQGSVSQTFWSCSFMTASLIFLSAIKISLIMHRAEVSEICVSKT